MELGRDARPTTGHLSAGAWGFQNWSHFWSAFGANSGPKMAPKIAKNLVKNTIVLGSIFGTLFFQVLELFGCLLGAFMGFLRLS